MIVKEKKEKRKIGIIKISEKKSRQNFIKAFFNKQNQQILVLGIIYFPSALQHHLKKMVAPQKYM